MIASKEFKLMGLGGICDVACTYGHEREYEESHHKDIHAAAQALIRTCKIYTNGQYNRALACAILNADLAETGILWGVNDDGKIVQDKIDTIEDRLAMKRILGLD